MSDHFLPSPSSSINLGMVICSALVNGGFKSSERKCAIVTFFDDNGVYDPVSHARLLEEVEKLGVPQCMMMFLAAWI